MTAPAAASRRAAPVVAGLGRLRPAQDRGRGARDRAGLRAAARLGWQMEANWTDPLLFFIYSVAKPLCAALILVVMLEVIGGTGGREYRAFVVVGSALWSFVVAGIAGLAWSILDDRERYRMLKYMYVSPSDFLVVSRPRRRPGRRRARWGRSITLGVGVVVLGVPFDLGGVDWVAARSSSMVLGLVSIIAIGRPAGGHLHADAPGVVVVPGGRRRRAVPRRRRGLPARRPARRGPGDRPA